MDHIIMETSLNETINEEPVNYPVDISYMVTDFKYNREDGLKICEVQHGSISALGGDIYISGGTETMLPMIAEFFDQFHLKKWVIATINRELRKSLVNKGWELEMSFEKLLDNSI